MSLNETDTNTAKTPTPFMQVFLEKWAPAIIVALIGTFAVPWLQTTFANRTELARRRLQLWESIGENFTNYINYCERLNDAAKSEIQWSKEGTPIPTQFTARKEEYREKRDQYSNALRRDFLLARFYYSETVKVAIDKYLAWHAQYRTVTVDKLPPDQDYLTWRDSIMTTIRNEL